MAEESVKPEVQSEINKIQMKSELMDVIVRYGQEKDVLCLDVIEVLADITKEMVNTINSADDEEEPDGQQTGS